MNTYDHLKVAALPLDIHAGQPAANLAQAKAMIEALPQDVDVAVLPELFNTGFVPDAAACSAMAEDNDGPAMQLVRNLASRRGIAIAGTFLARNAEGQLFNRAFLIEPTGETMLYDKRHLFMLSDEPNIITPGASLPPVCRFRGWNISIVVCYDLRFPAWCRNVGLRYDLLLVPANWPGRRHHAWKTLLEARAIENQAYVIGANRGGADFEGETYIIDHMGQPITPAPANSEDRNAPLIATLCKSSLEKSRATFPVWKSADPFTIL